MSNEAVAGGVAVGALSLPLVAGAGVAGGPLAAALALVGVVGLTAGVSRRATDDGQECHRCGESNEPENAVCSACRAQL